MTTKRFRDKAKINCKHDYQPHGNSYYKRDGDRKTGLDLPKMDQSIAYLTLYCPKCADTVEVIHKDHRPKENSNE